MNLLYAGFCQNKAGGVLLVDFAEKTWGWDLPKESEDSLKEIYFEGQHHDVHFSNVKYQDGVTFARLGDDRVVCYVDGEWHEAEGVDIHSLDPPGIISEPFVAFFHNPPNIPEWFDHDNSPQVVTARPQFVQSLQNCQGIYVFSEHLKEWLLNNVGLPCPVNVLTHPTEEVSGIDRWSPANFLAAGRPRLVQVGYWLRRLHSIYTIKLPEHWRRIWLYGNPRALDLIAAEARNDKECASSLMLNPVELLRLDNNEYDTLLSGSVALIDVYDSSCNNAIIECVVRGTPALVKRLPPTEEYLGKGYPLFFDSLAEASEKVSSFSAVVAAHRYMVDLQKSNRFSGGRFLDDLGNSFIYRKISGSIPKIKPCCVVSLGVDCFPRAMLTKYGFKLRKADGELSMPFDLAFHPPHVVIDMIRSDFRGFWQASDLLINKDRNIVHRNGSVYNHESDDDAKLERFSCDDFTELRMRYSQRAANFTEALSGATGKVVFVNMGMCYPVELRDVIREKYPSLDFHILTLNLLWHASAYRDTYPNVEYGTEESEALGFSFYSVRRPFEGYVWYDAAHFTSRSGIEFENRVADIMSRAMHRANNAVDPREHGLEP